MASIRTIILALAATTLAGAAGAQTGQQPSSAQNETVELKVTQTDGFGRYLVNQDNAPLYLFTTDRTGGGAASISCDTECRDVWPLVTTGSGQPKLGQEVNKSLVGTMEFDGRTVVTYNGWPLYRYVADQDGLPPEGQDKHGFGGEWYLVTPEGEKLEKTG